jgi:hypothetical protein
VESKIPGSTDLKILYNFTYRLSGNIEVAKSLTEKAFLSCVNKSSDEVTLLKWAWEKFLLTSNKALYPKQDGEENILSLLEPELRCAVILRDIIGYSYEQIGKVLNKSKQEVAVVISLGRQEIREKVS